jgi:WD40 repeat protein
VPPTRTFHAEAPPAACALSPAGTEIAAALKNGKIQVWSLAGKPLRAWASGDTPVNGLFYAGESRLVVAIGGTVAVHDTASGQKLAGWQAHPRPIDFVVASRDVSFLATASDDGTVKLWKPDGTPIRSLAGGAGEFQVAAIAPAGNRVAAANSDTNVFLFETRTGAVQHVCQLEMSCYALDFAPDGRRLAAGSVDGSVSLWNAESGASMGILGRYPLPVGAVRFSPDGKHLATTGLSTNPFTAETESRIWDLASRKETTIPLGISTMNAIAFTATGRPIVLSIHDRTISIWDS